MITWEWDIQTKRGGVAIEHEDPVFSGKRFEEGLVRGFYVLDPLINPGAV